MVSRAQVEINKFVGGLFTDASPLTFPENTSAVDVNMDLYTDGSRKRALGIDYEDAFVQVDSGVPTSAINDIETNVYRWENVGGDPLKNIVCVQTGNIVKFFDADKNTMSANLLDTKVFTSSPANIKYSFTSVDGKLVVATGINLITTVTKTLAGFSYSTSTIKVRDFWGVEDKIDSEDYTSGQSVQKRPTLITSQHTYNLRNQSFGIPRVVNGGATTLVDPVTVWSGKYPSNSDTVTAFLYADANDGTDRNVRRFFASDLEKNPLGNFRAPMGYYIIDLLYRGGSRMEADAKNREVYPQLTQSASSLPQDKTDGGATVLAEFAGRVWYGGFSGDNIDPDSKSPNLSSYIAFSQLVTDPSMITNCYQDGDPTSDTEPDIVDTDGGYIRISNAYGISCMLNIGRNLFIGAANGWWRVYGGSDDGFSATNYIVDKITDKGVRGLSTVVEVEGGLTYWSDDGIYHIHQDKLGDWIAECISQNKIQKLYDGITVEEKAKAYGVYDSYQKKVRWLYSNRLNNVSQQKELVLDTGLAAFYERHISQVSGDSPPIVVASFNTNQFKINTVTENVVVNNVNVTVNGDIVTAPQAYRTSANSLYEVGYLVVTSISPTIKYTFASYSDTKWVDWRSHNGVGVDAQAVLVTGTGNAGDSMRYKQVPYFFVHMRRTEDGMEADSNGDLVPTNQSSCTVQSMWDWTNSANSNKWGSPFQAYRYKRVYMPVDINDDFDTGYEVITTRSKLRGRGKAISFKFTSSPGKEMHLYGWSLIVTGNDNV